MWVNIKPQAKSIVDEIIIFWQKAWGIYFSEFDHMLKSNKSQILDKPKPWSTRTEISTDTLFRSHSSKSNACGYLTSTRKQPGQFNVKRYHTQIFNRDL